MRWGFCVWDHEAGNEFSLRQNFRVTVEVAAEFGSSRVGQAEIERLVGLFENVFDQLDLNRLNRLAVDKRDDGAERVSALAVLSDKSPFDTMPNNGSNRCRISLHSLCR